ncbi:MAG: hypothetical protein GIW95_07660 [Candidatus Eremiobacteraeota bacterium]|nr:hypothetical protein [Candidatus Eremiobacteraeota bacterium]
MIRRRITVAEVEATLRFYETSTPGHTGARNFYKSISNRRIRVTVAPDLHTIITVTEETI